MTALVLLALALQAPPDLSDRLHRAMFTWTPGGARTPPGYEPDPLFWPLNIEKWQFTDDLLGALDAATKAPPPADPVRKALLQHDAWMFFDALEGFPLANSRSWPPEAESRRDDARRRLAPLLARLALTADERAALPDPYARAVAAKRWPAALDPARPSEPFLPPDLDEPEGPWVLAGARDGSALAREHARHFMGHATFLVYVSLPGGRKATLEYLDGLSKAGATRESARLPAGSRVVLRRRAMLLDAKGAAVPSPVTQEVQIRVARAGLNVAEGEGLFDFRLRRAELAAGKDGLHATGADERGDVFLFHRGPARERVRATCRECHGTELVPSSVLAPTGARDARGHAIFGPRAVGPTTPEREAEATARMRQEDRAAKRLREFWPKE